MHLNLIIKYFSGNISKEEETILFNWIKSSSKNQLLFDQFKILWEKSSEIRHFDKINSLVAWDAIKNSVRKKYTTRYEKISGFKFLSRIAAILILAFGLTYGLVKITGIFSKSTVFTMNSDNALKEIQLPDGSQITLNKNSYLSYTSGFNKKSRMVELEGEAFFNVVSNDALPFIILVKNSTIQVMGTQFNVIEDTTSIKVTVVSGKVLFYETANNKNRVELNRNETASFHMHSKKIIYGANYDSNYLSWKTGKFVFTKTPTIDALSTLADHFNKKLIVQVPVKDSITGVFDNQPLIEILEEIEMTSSLKIEHSEDYIIVKK